jgi:hypothetical protein
MFDLVVIYDGDDKCTGCLGWKRVNNGDEGISWKYWAEIPAPSNIAVQLGIVRAIECPRCRGTGVEPKLNNGGENA